MNFKQKLYCKVLGWNGKYQNPGFVKVPELFFELQTDEQKIEYLRSVSVEYDYSYRHANKFEAEEVLSVFKAINNYSLAAYEALACGDEKES